MKLEVEVAKETYELASAVATLVGVVRKAVADGWQSGTDLPVIMTTALAVLPGAIDGFDKLGAEFKADKGQMVLALAVALDKAL